MGKSNNKADSNATIIGNDLNPKDITYSELLNNPMKKHEIYQMEMNHNKFMKLWVDFEIKDNSHLNDFIKNVYFDLYDFLYQVSSLTIYIYIFLYYQIIKKKKKKIKKKKKRKKRKKVTVVNVISFNYLYMSICLSIYIFIFFLIFNINNKNNRNQVLSIQLEIINQIIFQYLKK